MTNYNTGNLIDVRGVMGRVEELEGERDGFDTCGLCQGADGPITTFANPEPHTCVDCGGTGEAGVADWAAECTDDAEELVQLTELLADLAGSGGDEQWRGDWYPQELIAEDYFTAHARQLAEDCGMVKADASWPNNHIDWEAAADQLKDDYTRITFGGGDWWYR